MGAASQEKIAGEKQSQQAAIAALVAASVAIPRHMDSSVTSAQGHSSTQSYRSEHEDKKKTRPGSARSQTSTTGRDVQRETSWTSNSSKVVEDSPRTASRPQSATTTSRPRSASTGRPRSATTTKKKTSSYGYASPYGRLS